jgi:hypothetical protein
MQIHEDDDEWEGALDSDGEPCRWHNHYECDHCVEYWTDDWSCCCNDRCPVCDRETEPYKSEWLALDGETIITTDVNE